MTREHAQAICRERLESWTRKLVAELSTPVLLVGVGHAEKMGQIVLATVEDLDNKTLRGFLRFALHELRD